MSSYSITNKIMAVLLSVSLSTASAELPYLGDPTQKEISPYLEYLMGKNFYKTLKANLPFIDDLAVNDYISTLGQKLVSQSDQPDKEFNFFILKIPSINAFAGPDAHIGIHTGLFLAADNESQLAGVLAHEVSHVTQRHLARAMTESNTSSAAVFAAILAGIIIASQNPQAGAAVLYGGTAAMMQSQINFTRHNEYEADRIGISVLRNAGINPQGMAEFFETLLRNADSNNALARIEYLRTHPLNSARVAEAKHRILEKDKKLPDDSLNFQLSKSRIIVSTTHSLQELIQKIKSLKKEKQNITTRYTHAIALIAYDKPEQAIDLLKNLVKEKDHPWFQLALAKAYENNNQKNNALKTLTKLAQLYPNYLPVSIEYTHLLNHFSQHEEAIQVLKRQLQQKDKSIIYRTLAQTYYANGQITSALEATSHQYELEGHLKLAAQQVDNALKQTGLKPSTKQRLEGRKKELTSQLRKERQY
jgi:beta-barrel assembly-enhancing protease